MNQSKLPSAHNKFFQFALSHLPIARDLIEMQVPLEVQHEIDFDTLKIETGSFIDPDLAEKYSDLLLSASLRSPKGESATHSVSNTQTLIYFLLEHKSDADPLTVLQLLSYIVRIWEQRVRDGLPLCPIYPIVVYHGARKWTAARKIEDLVAAPASLGEHQVRFGFQLLDLSQLTDDQIVGGPLLQSTMRLLKYSRSSELTAKLRQILELVAASTESTLQTFWVRAIGVYVMAVNKNLNSEELDHIVCDVFPTLIEPGSLAHRLLIQGRDEGREEGRGEGKLAGKIQMLQELLGERLSTDEELMAQDVDQLNRIIGDLQARLRKRDE